MRKGYLDTSIYETVTETTHEMVVYMPEGSSPATVTIRSIRRIRDDMYTELGYLSYEEFLEDYPDTGYVSEIKLDGGRKVWICDDGVNLQVDTMLGDSETPEDAAKNFQSLILHLRWMHGGGPDWMPEPGWNKNWNVEFEAEP